VSDTAELLTVPWDEFLAEHFTWSQGEHVTLIGPTGVGKTTALLALLPFRSWVALIGTKPRDATLSRLLARGWRRVTTWPPPYGASRVLLWPHVDAMADIPRQRDIIGSALAHVYASGGWCIAADDLHYLAKSLGLAPELDVLYVNGRSVGITMVAAFQRPFHVPQTAMDQSTHLLLWRQPELRDRRRVAELVGDLADLVLATLPPLDEFDVLYVNNRTGRAIVTRAPNPNTPKG
jgi:hypothetical protein